MSERIWTDINQKQKMRNRDLPVFPITETIQEETKDGLKVTQKTIGGNTKFEQAVFQIAQGLAQRPNMAISNIPEFAEEITTKIFDRLDKDK